jgi:hypothetical protein
MRRQANFRQAARRQKDPGEEGNHRHARRPKDRRQANFRQANFRQAARRQAARCQEEPGEEGTNRHVRRPKDRRQANFRQAARRQEGPGEEDLGQGCREKRFRQEPESEVAKAPLQHRCGVVVALST